MKWYLKQWVHNVIVHQMMGWCPCRATYWVHDVSGRWSFKEIQPTTPPGERV